MQKIIRILIVALLLCFTISTSAFAILVEKRIQSGEISTVNLIGSIHPRILTKGNWDWSSENNGSFAWRIMHGQTQGWPWEISPANDQEKLEFSYSAFADSSDSYGADNMYNNYTSDFVYRVLESILAGKALKLGWQDSFGSGFDPAHTSDEYFADAREKLLNLVGFNPSHEAPYIVALYGSTAYDWLFSETFTNGNSVLSEADKSQIRDRLFVHGDYLKGRAPEQGLFFDATNTDNFYYAVIGLALYEPSKVNNPEYAATNAKAKSYLDAFDNDFIKKVLPALNLQGEDGGWHGGLSRISGPYLLGGLYENNTNAVPLMMAPVLFAHYTATGQSFEDSLFSTGVLKHFAEFQAHMILPFRTQQLNGAQYYRIGGTVGEWNRMAWVLPMRAYSRRRFSPDDEQKKIGELGAWIRTSYGKSFTDYGSWDMIDQVLFEDKWVNPRSPQNIGFPLTRHFQKLGWAFMRSGFTSENDLASLFICQPYHWSHLDPYAQNSITLARKGQLIEGFNNTIYLDGQYQRSISNFPSVSQGVGAYAPDSTYDVGSGIVEFYSSSVYDYMKGDATKAYAANKLNQFTRQLVYLKPDIFIMFDKVVTPTSGIEKKWVLDPATMPVDRGNNIVTITNGNGELWIKRMLPASATVSLSTSQIAVVPSQAATETYFLHVMQAVDSGSGSSQVSVDDATLTQEGDWYNVEVAGHMISFSQSGSFRFAGSSIPISNPIGLFIVQ